MIKQLTIIAGYVMIMVLTLTLTFFNWGGGVRADHGDSYVHTIRSIVQPTVGIGDHVTVSIQVGDALRITETLPEGFTYHSTTLSENRGRATVIGEQVRFTILRATSFEYTVKAPDVPGTYTITGLAQFDFIEANDRDIVGSSMVTVGIRAPVTPDPLPMTRSASSVDARPDDPGDATQITVKFEISKFLAIDESITLEVTDGFGVPSSISPSGVSIRGMAAESADVAASPEYASPRSVIVETDSAVERHVITLNIGNMDDSVNRDTDKGLAAGLVTVIFHQEAGLTNRTEGGSDDWFVKTSAEDLLDSLTETGDLDEGQIETVYSVPWTISLSSYAGYRGQEITAIGKGFKKGTTTKFWLDKDMDGVIDSAETNLCDRVADGKDTATCKFTLSNPPFAPGKAMNHVNAIDGMGNTAGDATKDSGGNFKRRAEFKQIELEPSLSVSPKLGFPGDSINVQLHDFQDGDIVERIEFARTIDICGIPTPGAGIILVSGKKGGKTNTAGIPTCQSIGAAGSVGSNGSLSFSFELPNSVRPGSQDLRVHTTNGNANTTFTVVTVGIRAPVTPDPLAMTRRASSVDARPDDPGDATQITVKFEISKFLAIDESITLEVTDGFGVPSSISPSGVSIRGMAAESADVAASPEYASPRSVIVETDSAVERHVITLNIGNMDDSVNRDTDKGLAAGLVTVIFRQEAGLTNRTEGGSDDWFVKTSAEDLLDSLTETGDLDEGQIETVYSVPWTISLSSYAGYRGQEITAIGKGFKKGTTTKFWLDKDMDGVIDSAETNLCDRVADGKDTATCKFTLSNPPFAPGKAMNHVNAIDGMGNTAGDATKDSGGNFKRRAEFKQIELEPSLSVSPKLGFPGDSINVQLHDFQDGDIVERIEFARTIDICGIPTPGAGIILVSGKKGGKTNTAGIPTCQSIGAAGSVGSNGSLSFSFELPNSVRPGSQDLRVHTTNGNANTTFTVGTGGLHLSGTDVLPNQRIWVSGSGLTKSSQSGPAWIGNPKAAANSCPEDANGGLTSMGSIALGGQTIPWSRINGGDGIEVTSGGSWSAAIDLPVNSSSTSAGTRHLKVEDCRGGSAAIDLTFAEREVTMTPAEGRVGTEVVITGKNYPAENREARKVEVTVEYNAGSDTDDDDIKPDAFGNFTVILEVPENANIPSSNTVSVKFTDDENAEVVDTFTHRVPQATVSFSATRGAEGKSLIITAEGFARYSRVDLVEFGDREITPSPNFTTDTNGNAEFSVRIPGSDPGIYIIRVEIDTVVATSPFTVVSGSGASGASVETVLANAISEGALDRVFRFENATKEWSWYIADPAFSASNNLAGLSSGDLVFIKVTEDITVDILGTSTTMTCGNDGLGNEDCWNLISTP